MDGLGGCNTAACDEASCEETDQLWTLDCPGPPPTCDPLAPSAQDPSCTGPPKAIDRFGKKMYARTLVAKDKPQDDEEEGVLCHITLALCPGETMITQEIDSGLGDYYRLSNVPGDKWSTFTGPVEVDGNADYMFGGMYKSGQARSSSPVTPLNQETAQFVIKQARSNEDDCTRGVDCLFGMSELVCMAPLGTEFLLSAVPDHGSVPDTTHYVYKPNTSPEPGNGPYTINLIGSGVALTEINIGIINDLMNPVNSVGSFSTVKEVNHLWANSYWANSEWIWERPNRVQDNLAREMQRSGLKYGVRLNQMNIISREERPESDLPMGRIDYDILGEAFGLENNSTDKDPNIKWFVVGSSGFKKAMYPLIEQWGFDIEDCSAAAAKKGYPKCGPNSLYNQEAPGAAGLLNRERSALFQYYAKMDPVPGPNRDKDRHCKSSKRSKSWKQ